MGVGRTRFTITVIQSIFSQSTVVPATSFMNLLIFVTATSLKSQVKFTQIYHCPKIVKYRILQYGTPPLCSSNFVCLQTSCLYNKHAAKFLLSMQQNCSHQLIFFPSNTCYRDFSQNKMEKLLNTLSRPRSKTVQCYL